LEKERRSWIFLNHIPEVVPVMFHRLLYLAKSAQGILELSAAGLEAAGLASHVAGVVRQKLRSPDQLRWLDAEMDRLDRGVCQVVTELDVDYPEPLRELLDRPPVLYYIGRWPLPQAGVLALVGTRRLTSYGRSVAERLATDLSVQGIVTVSGLARGIDTCVHRATLHAGGHTVAVLGCGLGQVFPKENAGLQAQIAKQGTLISEFSYHSGPASEQFPRRNRIVAGLSEGVVVIEAGLRSGAGITARYAVEQGRDVFAVPGSIFAETSSGCHRLIKQGAKLVESAADILDELGVAKNPEAVAPPPPPKDFGPLSDLETHILKLLSDETLSTDEISRSTAQRFEQVANSLLGLELKGAVRSLPGQRYAKNP
jgi:DNA processing protein